MSLQQLLGNVTPQEVQQALLLRGGGPAGTLPNVLGHVAPSELFNAQNLAGHLPAPPVAQQLAGQVVGESSSMGRLASLAGRVPGVTTGPGSTLLESLGGWKGFGGKGGMLKAGARAVPYALAGDLAAKGINLLPGNQDVKDVFGNVAAGAGLGAAVGTFVPIPGVGTASGALVGGALGLGKGVLEAFTGDDEPDTKKLIEEGAIDLGLGTNSKHYQSLYDLLVESGGDKKEVAQQIAQQMMADAQSKQQYTMQQGYEGRRRESDQKYALAMQSQAAQFMAPHTTNIVNAGIAQANALKSLASRLPPEFAGVFENQAATALGDSQRIAGAYAAQSALAPQIFMQAQQAKYDAQLADLQYKQSVIDSQQGGSGGFDEAVAAMKQQG